MRHKKMAMENDKKIALVAHDNKKFDLVEWAKFNRVLLAHHKIYATGTTGEILEKELGFKINKLQSGPLGGDQQIGAKIADSEIDFHLFLGSPRTAAPRSGCQSAFAYGGCLEHPGSLQSHNSRFYDLLSFDG